MIKFRKAKTYHHDKDEYETKICKNKRSTDPGNEYVDKEVRVLWDEIVRLQAEVGLLKAKLDRAGTLIGGC